VSNKRTAKAGDSESRPRYVALYHAEVDSMAFKTLSPNAVWLLVQLKRAWRGSYENIMLPFAYVSWKLTFAAFSKARLELIEAGFLRVVKPGGLYKNPAVYALTEGWRGEVAKRLADNPEAGYLRGQRTKDGVKSVWYPAKKRRASIENAAKARAARATKKTAPRVRPVEPAPTKAAHPNPTLNKRQLERVRVAKLIENGDVFTRARDKGLRTRN